MIFSKNYHNSNKYLNKIAWRPTLDFSRKALWQNILERSRSLHVIQWLNHGNSNIQQGCEIWEVWDAGHIELGFELEWIVLFCSIFNVYFFKIYQTWWTLTFRHRLCVHMPIQNKLFYTFAQILQRRDSMQSISLITWRQNKIFLASPSHSVNALWMSNRHGYLWQMSQIQTVRIPPSPSSAELCLVPKVPSKQITLWASH